MEARHTVYNMPLNNNVINMDGIFATFVQCSLPKKVHYNNNTSMGILYLDKEPIFTCTEGNSEDSVPLKGGNR